MRKSALPLLVMTAATLLAALALAFYLRLDRTPPVAAPELSGPGTGLGLVASASAADGQAEVLVTVSAVLLDGEGRIQQCVIDVAQNRLPVQENGALALPEQYQTKRELGDDYGMIVASGIGREWYQQADTFAAHVTGMTVQEVAALPMQEGYAADVDLTAGCTIAVGDFVAATVEACQNAQTLGAAEGDSLRLGVVTSNAYGNTDATAEADGRFEVDTTLAAVTLDESGAVTSAVLDVLAPVFTVNASGEITAPTSLSSKRELGDDYGMAVASGIGKEWYQQSDALGRYLTGRTAGQIAGLPTDGSDADLTAGCTIAVNDLLAAAAKTAA